MMSVTTIIGKLRGSRAYDCQSAQETMSAFIDSMTTREESERLEAHVQDCAACRRQLQGYVSLRNFAAGFPAPVVPEDLELETRISLSRVRAANFRTRFNTHVENVLRPHALPALAGVVATCLCFTFLLGSLGTSLAIPPDDLSVLWLQTQPRAADPLILQLAELGLDSVTVEVEIDQQGKAFSTVISNGPQDPAVDQRLKDVLLRGKFYPATIYGQPIASRMILSFVGVRGSPIA